MRIAAGFFTALFLVAAAVQWNDPDPWHWIAGYLLAAGLSAAAVRGRSPWIPNLLASAVFALWFSSLAPSLVGADPAAFQSFQMAAASHEVPREAIGLALCAVWCAILAWHDKKTTQ